MVTELIIKKDRVAKILGDLSRIRAHQVGCNVVSLKIGMIISAISLVILSGYKIAKRKLKRK